MGANVAALANAPGGPDAGVVASLERAMAEQSAPDLAATIQRASQQTPQEYRAALRNTLGKDLAGASDLQRHLSMLDANHDGKVTLSESYNTLRDLKFGPVKAALVAGAAQLALVLSTGGGAGTAFRIAGATDKSRHATVDTGAFAQNAQLDSKIDELMAADTGGKGYITYDDMKAYIEQKKAASTAGTVAKTLTALANEGEFKALFDLAGPNLTRNDLHDFFTGSLFYSLLPPSSLAERLVNLRSS
jgi:hypothetical protein